MKATLNEPARLGNIKNDLDLCFVEIAFSKDLRDVLGRLSCNIVINHLKCWFFANFTT